MAKRTHRFVDEPPKGATYTYEQIVHANERGMVSCAWSNCPRFVAPESKIRLCTGHYALVVNDWIDKAEAHKAARRAPLEPGATGTGSVYYALIDGLVKIGYAADVAKRMRSYPPSTRLLAVEPGTLHTEAQRHDQFRAYLARGREWFRDTPELQEWIDTVRAEHGSPHRMEHRWTGPRDTIRTVRR